MIAFEYDEYSKNGKRMRVTKLYHYLLFVIFYGKKIVFKSYILIAQILRHKSKIAIYPGNANDVFLLCDYCRDAVANYNAAVHS